MPKKIYLVLINNNTRDVQECRNYKCIKQMNHIIKVWKKKIEKLLREKTIDSKTYLDLSHKSQQWKNYNM